MLSCLHPFAARGAALNRAVEVWLADPALLAAECQAQRACLSRAELQRLDSLHFPRDRTLYLASHVLLRHLLSLYQPHDPADWVFETTPQGRPELVQPMAAPENRLRFSLSHTRGLIAVAVARGWAVGVDVERPRTRLDVAALAPLLLAPAEKTWFAQVEPAGREAAFLHLWTLKEALLKACGAGIGTDLAYIALLHSVHDAQVVITRSRHLACYPEWSVVFGSAEGGCALAVAAHGRLCTSPQAAVERRRLAVFDLRQPQVPLQGRSLCNARLLPVKAASTTSARPLVPA